MGEESDRETRESAHPHDWAPLMHTLKVVGCLVVGLLLVACDSQAPTDSAAAAPAGSTPAAGATPATPAAGFIPAAGADTLNAAVMQKWSRSCALCHVTGNAGAPRVGNVGEWQERLTQGAGVLLTHTIEGINDMPPLGYCMSCEREDFIAMIDFMAGESTGDTP